MLHGGRYLASSSVGIAIFMASACASLTPCCLELELCLAGARTTWPAVSTCMRLMTLCSPGSSSTTKTVRCTLGAKTLPFLWISLRGSKICYGVRSQCLQYNLFSVCKQRSVHTFEHGPLIIRSVQNKIRTGCRTGFRTHEDMIEDIT